MNAQTETQDAEVSTDGPLLDLTDAGVKKFIKQAKARGYDTKVMRKVIALRKRDKDDIAEEEAVLEMYKEALGM